jgi:hypothetical protein
LVHDLFAAKQIDTSAEEVWFNKKLQWRRAKNSNFEMGCDGRRRANSSNRRAAGHCQSIFSSGKSINRLIYQTVRHTRIFGQHMPDPHVSRRQASLLLAQENPRRDSRFSPASIQPFSGHHSYFFYIGERRASNETLGKEFARSATLAYSAI